MKRFGIWLVLLVMVLALVATPLASRLVQVRGSWQKKTAEAKLKVLELRKRADEVEKAATNSKGELQRTIYGWERHWNGVQVVAGGQPGSLVVSLGTNQGFTPAVAATVYAFQPLPDGSMSFVGAFKISQAQEIQAALTPVWRLRPDEDQTWRYGPNWRLRSNIPLPTRTRFSEYDRVMLVKDELLAQQQLNLKYQEEAKAKAEEHLGLRLKELHGDPAQATKNLDKFLIEGYHKAVADLEVARNSVQGDVDDLRRQIKRTRDEIERLTNDNERLADEGARGVPRAAANKK
ncbi:MAG: hypothetical protein ACKV2Q_07575 [Planctomycetaceae bacterium]